MLEPMNHDTALLTILQGLGGGNDSITHRGGGLSSGKRHNSGSNMAPPPSRRTLSSTSPQVAGSFSRGDLSPARKTSLQSQETVEL